MKKQTDKGVENNELKHIESLKGVTWAFKYNWADLKFMILHHIESYWRLRTTSFLKNVDLEYPEKKKTTLVITSLYIPHLFYLVIGKWLVLGVGNIHKREHCWYWWVIDINFYEKNILTNVHKKPETFQFPN